MCPACRKQKSLEDKTVICAACHQPFLKHSAKISTVYCSECKENGRAKIAETENQSKLAEIINKNINFQNLVTLMFDIYFNLTTVDNRKISYSKDTSVYYKFEFENLNKSIQTAKSFVSKLSAFLYKDFAERKISEEEIKVIIKKILDIHKTNYWHYFSEPTNSICETAIKEYLKCHNIVFNIKTNIDEKAYKFLFNFIPDGGKQLGKGEFLRSYAGHLPPNLIGYGDCMIRTNAVAELKNAIKGEHGSLMYNRHNYYTADGTSEIILTRFINNTINIINDLKISDSLKLELINLCQNINNISDFVWSYTGNGLYNKIANKLEFDIRQKSVFIYKTMFNNLMSSEFIRNILRSRLI